MRQLVFNKEIFISRMHGANIKIKKMLLCFIHRNCMLEESVFVKAVAECWFDYNPRRYGYIVTWCNVFRWDLIKTGRVPDVTNILQIATKHFRSIMRSWRSVEVSCLLLWNVWNACCVFPLSSHDVGISNKVLELINARVIQSNTSFYYC